MLHQLARCPCCLGKQFQEHQILWPGLIQEWGLQEAEAVYLNRQQGLRCTRCRTSLRGMVLAEAIMRATGHIRPFALWVLLRQRQRVLEVNPAAELHRFLRFSRRATLTNYPDVDIQALPYEDASFDLVVHSDTLEHVPDSLRALEECRRVLTAGGVLCYTVPVVLGRLTRMRDPHVPSYHGLEGHPDYLVVREYGTDFWEEPLRAGFSEVRVVTLGFPAGIALICRA